METSVEKQERVLRGGPWAWCLQCSYERMVPVHIKYSVWRKRWECADCKRPVDMLKCDRCGFEGGDATQLPAPKRPWGFRIFKRINGHKKVCPRCGDISVFPVAGETPSDDGKGGVAQPAEEPRPAKAKVPNPAPAISDSTVEERKKLCERCETRQQCRNTEGGWGFFLEGDRILSCKGLMKVG